MEKKIGILSAVLSGLTFIALVISPMKFGSVTAFFNLFAFDTLEMLSLRMGDFDSVISINSNYISVALTGCLIAGTWVYINSGYRNFRMLRFVYGVLLFKLIMTLPMTLVYMYSYYFGLETTFYTGYDLVPAREFKLLDVLRSLLALASVVFFVVASYKILEFFNSKLHLKSQTEDYDYYKRTFFFETKKVHRFLHLVIDNIFLYTVFYSLLMSLVRFRFGSDLIHGLERVLGEKGSLLLVTSVFRILYFVFFECQFRATPGKFLTQTRVMQYDGTEATTGNIISRTFCRLVPLESITFLLGYNLHDNWSSTAVYDEVAIDEATEGNS